MKAPARRTNSGLPVRYNWAAEYRGHTTVVYGHTPVPTPEWLNRTINIDTGCVFGGQLTALRYPEKEMVSVKAKKVYCEPIRPLKTDADADSPLTVQQKYDDLLEAEDVIGKRFISTRLRRNVTIREEQSMAALEVMSRFAANPKWLIYLPPTMSPTETSQQGGYLEYPEEGFAYFRSQGIPRVICQEKHMGVPRRCGPLSKRRGCGKTLWRGKTMGWESFTPGRADDSSIAGKWKKNFWIEWPMP